MTRSGRRRGVVAVGTAVAVLLAAGGRAQGPAAPEPATPAEHRRAPEQTLLTFPEWFLVFSPAEYAAHLARRPPSEFPFLGHLAQFWGSYRSIWSATREYPFNSEYHVMIWVIGVSTTVEYALREAYETLVGRLSELVSDYGTTEEDELAAEVAREYVEFIRVEPWYKFDYVRALGRLWGTSFWGPDLVRKWERKYALTTEWGVKALYAVAMKKGTQASYGEAVPETAVVLRDLPQGIGAELPKLVVLERRADASVLVTVPRYEAFTSHAVALAKGGAQFLEVAGNRGPILVTALVPGGGHPPGSARVLFTQDILTEPGTKRFALLAPVADLGPLLTRLSAPPWRLEHVFDY